MSENPNWDAYIRLLINSCIENFSIRFCNWVSMYFSIRFICPKEKRNKKEKKLLQNKLSKIKDFPEIWHSYVIFMYGRVDELVLVGVFEMLVIFAHETFLNILKFCLYIKNNMSDLKSTDTLLRRHLITILIPIMMSSMHPMIWSNLASSALVLETLKLIVST